MLKNEMIYRTTNANSLLSNINQIHALAGIKADKQNVPIQKKKKRLQSGDKKNHRTYEKVKKTNLLSNRISIS